jgi:lysyl-tRNA synthetase class II
MTEQTQNANQPEDNKLIAERRAKLANLREQGNAFPNDFRRDATAAELQEKYGDKSKEELEAMGIQVAIAGRMMLDRKAFKVVQDMTGRILATSWACAACCANREKATSTWRWMSTLCSPSRCVRCLRSIKA